jgi:ADP-ribose pyrophosphatase YjhB (NUDIX family)
MPDFIKVYVAAGVVVKQDGKYLLVQEKKPSAYGLWNLPAGRVEEGDSVEKTAVKETKEETGYDIELIRHLDIFQGDGDGTSTCAHAFEAKIIGGRITCSGRHVRCEMVYLRRNFANERKISRALAV